MEKFNLDDLAAALGPMITTRKTDKHQTIPTPIRRHHSLLDVNGGKTRSKKEHTPH